MKTAGKHRRVPDIWQALRLQVSLSRQAHAAVVSHGLANAVLVVFERAAPALAGLLLASNGPAWALALGVGMMAASVLRNAVSLGARSRFQSIFARDLARAIVSRSALFTPSSNRVQTLCFMTIYSAANAAVVGIPVVTGDLIAAAAMAPVLIAYVDAWLVLLVVPCLGAAMGVSIALQRAAARATDESWVATQVFVDDLAMMTNGRTELIAAGRAQQMAERLAKSARQWAHTAMRADRLGTLGGRAPVAVLAGAIVLVGWLWLRHEPGSWTGTASRGLILGTALAIAGSLAHAAVDFARNSRDLLAIKGILDAPADPVTLEGAPAGDPRAAIVVESVSFSYGGPGAALRRMSFQWKPGELIALSGANGSGKSTMMRLLLRLGDPSEGAITIGTRDLRTIDAAQWRRSIAFLPQRPYLPEQWTVRDALSWTGEQAGGRAEEALEALGLLRVLRQREPGDPLSVLVEALSQGERQKVALARVLGSSTPILLLDEPDSWLDAAAVEALGDLLREQSTRRRVMFVGHDPRLVERADRVVRFGPAERVLAPVAVA